MKNGFDINELTTSALHNWYHADEHALITLPLHWDRFQNPIRVLNLEISAPANREEIAGDIVLSWSPGILLQSGKTEILYSIDGGRTDYPLGTIASADSSYLWSTTDHPDGTRYKLRFNVEGRTAPDEDSVTGVAYTSGHFTINNPGNGYPEIVLTSLVEAEHVTGEYLVTWIASDADGDSLTYAIDYSPDNGRSWYLLAEQLKQPSFLWQSMNYENSKIFQIAVHAHDGQASRSDTSDVFEVYNERIPAEDNRFTQITGNGTPLIELFIIDPEDIDPGAIYQISFDDTSFGEKVFYVINKINRDTLIKAGDQLDRLRESDLFNGRRLLIDDYTTAEINEPLTRWETTSSNPDISVFLPNISIGGSVRNGIPYPADYRIAIADQIIDSTSNVFETTAKGVYFIIRNLSENKDADFIYQDQNKDQKLGDHDLVYLLEKNANQEYDLIWAFTLSGPANPVPPAAGDHFLISTYKPVISILSEKRFYSNSII